MTDAMTAPARIRQAPHRPVKAVSEATRERETFKYDPSLFADFRFNNTGNAFPSSELVSSGDSILTGLCQLGAYQTGAERSFISLFDIGYQYIVAEAVPTMSLDPYLPSDRCPAPLALCGVAIPRSHGTCEHVLYLANPTSKGDDVELPLSLVPNLAADDRFNRRPYCQFGEAGQFYAAVPIRTHRGINIGSYCVMSTKQPAGWNDRCADRLRDVSRAIMGHLEANRSKNMNLCNERLNRGVRSLIEGESTLCEWQSDGRIADSPNPTTPESILDGSVQVAGTGDPSGRPQRRHRNPAAKPPPAAPARAQSVTDRRGRASLVFSKAARIMREAFDVEGCLFFDVSLGSYRRLSVQSPTAEPQPASPLSSTSSSDERSAEATTEPSDASCDVLGFSTRTASSVDPAASLDGDVGMLPKRTLAKLLRRYPGGKIFSFDAVGELQSSDSDDEDGAPAHHRRDTMQNGSVAFAPTTQEKSLSRTLKEGALIRRAFPNARCIAFIPVWDSKRERWFAGGFLYTRAPTRVFTLEGDLSFLKAFASLAATEVLNQEILQADQAKSDALGSLSHELRTPLHGVLLGTELLNDTDLDVFQGNLAHTIETCCRTLLDTIDHLLDYSKVNSFATKQRPEARNLGKAKRVVGREQFGKKQLFSHVRLDGLVEEVAETMFAGYCFRHIAPGQLSGRDNSMQTGTSACNLSASTLTDGLSAEKNHRGQPGNNSDHDVSIHLSIDPSCSWMFHIQAGAIRRIVMNLLGNALKYTASGSVWVSLEQEDAPAKRPSMERIVKMTVRDTGKGIGEEFLRHKLFRPFSQEDELAPGTGLGLSLVKSIVSGLGGHISVKSQVSVGSTFTVTLPLERSPQLPEASIELSEEDKLFDEQVRELTGLRVSLVGFEPGGHGSGVEGRAAVESICRDWLRLDLSCGKDAPELAADLVLWSHEALPDSPEELMQLAKTPNIIVCHDSLTAHRRIADYTAAGCPGVFEFISQPIGSRKLARSMQLAYKRWTGMLQALPTPHPTGPSRTVSYAGHAQTPGLVPALTPGSLGGQLSPLQALADLSLPSRSSPRPHPTLEPTTSYFPPFPGTVEETSQIVTPTLTERDTFLLVDDNQINLKVLSAYMAKLQLAFVAVVNGKEAVDAYVENPGRFAAILMDLSMPVMDGLEATRQIRAHEARGQLEPVAVFALTGLASDRTHQEALESGVDVFLTKPVSLQTLRQTLGLDIPMLSK